VSTYKNRTVGFSTLGNNQRKTYTLSNEDYLTLLRAVEFEGEPREAVAWTLLQRFAFLYPKYDTLTKFIRAYAQPINPRWFPNGDLHQQQFDALVREKKLTEADEEMKRASKRRVYAATPLEKISRTTRDIVDTLFLGGDSPVPGSVHYRAPTVKTTSAEEAKKARDAFAAKYQLQRVIDYGDPTRQNWFFGQAKSINFRIQTLLTDASSLGAALFILACTAGSANLLYRLYVGWRFSS
jgi:hypothetical protein